MMSNYYYLYCCLLPLAIIWLYRRYVMPLQFFRRLGVPGPQAYPIVGTLLADTQHSSANHEVQMIQTQKYGRVFGTFIGSRPCYVISDPDIIRHIFIKDFSKFPNRAIFLTLPTLDTGIVNLKDERWKHVRTVLNPTFTTSKMKQMLPIVTDSIDTLISKLQKIADTDQCGDFWDMLGKLSMEIIAASAFGTKCDAQCGTDDRLIQSAVAALKPKPLVIALCFIIPPLANFFMALDRACTNGLNYLINTVKSIIKARRRESATQANYKDLLQLMIDASKKADNKVLSDDEIFAQSNTFLLAGYETTASCMAFTTYLLATNPQIQDKLREEIASICNDEDQITYEMIGKMTYLDMVISESLRMYPPGYLLLREAKVDFQCKGYTFPKGIAMVVPVYCVHHDPELWPQPDKFDPQRFTKEAIETRHPSAYLPFGAGPRNCIGMRFALMEAKLCIAKILLRFNLLPSPQTQTPLKISAVTTLTPKDGLPLRIQSI